MGIPAAGTELSCLPCPAQHAFPWDLLSHQLLLTLLQGPQLIPGTLAGVASTVSKGHPQHHTKLGRLCQWLQASKSSQESTSHSPIQQQRLSRHSAGAARPNLTPPSCAVDQVGVYTWEGTALAPNPSSATAPLPFGEPRFMAVRAEGRSLLRALSDIQICFETPKVSRNFQEASPQNKQQ